MATSKENDLIGYDPLAWMEGNANNSEDHLLIDDSDTELDFGEPDQNNEPQFLDTEIGIIDGLSDNLAVITEEYSIETTDDDFLIDKIQSEDDNISIEEDVANDYVEPLSETIEEAVSSQVDLDATLTIQHVVKLHEQLKRCLAVHDQIEINASDVASIDTSTLQLLVSLKKDAVKLHKQIDIIYPSPRFIESAQLLGLLNILDIQA
ncbi:MAG: hypothetical protein RLZ75_198 [Pseudomonadota bacterium]|jgi:anti-anti-sigma regulatory factor